MFTMALLLANELFCYPIKPKRIPVRVLLITVTKSITTWSKCLCFFRNELYTVLFFTQSCA